MSSTSEFVPIVDKENILAIVDGYQIINDSTTDCDTMDETMNESLQADFSQAENLIIIDDPSPDGATMNKTILNESLQSDFGPIVVECNSLATGVKESVEFVEGESSVLFGVVVKDLDAAFDLYNDHAFRMGFSVRKGKFRYTTDRKKVVRLFLCWKSGEKLIKGTLGKAYSKRNERSGCAAYVKFGIMDDGRWKVIEHNMTHNHSMCPVEKRHLLRSHRRIKEIDKEFIKSLVNYGVDIATTIRVLKGQVGGSPFLGYTAKDVYNMLSVDKLKQLDGTDANALVQIFRSREANEKDFFFDFRIGDDNRLADFFFADGQMRADYADFDDYLGYDTTHRTNRYEMICGPFIGMNNYCKNLMFGCCFLLNERVESFVWVFQTFLRCMGGKAPKTIMTDQCPKMASAIQQVFPTTCHRLCGFHITKNSKIHIKGLRKKPGFVDLFEYMLSHCETKAEFDFYWEQMCQKYNCRTNEWLIRLHVLREKWCPAFSKDYFSGGALSSQRSETTNKSISARVSKKTGLCDFYHLFVTVIAEWRSKENIDCFKDWQGRLEMTFGNIQLLLHAREVYSSDIYLLFEEQFLKAAACIQSIAGTIGSAFVFHVWREGTDMIKHSVQFDPATISVSCTCKHFTQVGILCCHCLRILNISCVLRIPDQYILRRWRKDLLRQLFPSDRNANQSNVDVVSSSIWRVEFIRKFTSLISQSESNAATRKLCEEAFATLSESIKTEIGSVPSKQSSESCVDRSKPADVIENATGSTLPADVIGNPTGAKPPGRKSKRLKSTIEKKTNMARGRRKAAATKASKTKAAAQGLVQEAVSVLVGDGSLANSFERTSSLLRLPPIYHDISDNVASTLHGAEQVFQRGNLHSQNVDPTSHAPRTSNPSSNAAHNVHTQQGTFQATMHGDRRVYQQTTRPRFIDISLFEIGLNASCQDPSNQNNDTH